MARRVSLLIFWIGFYLFFIASLAAQSGVRTDSPFRPPAVPLSDWYWTNNGRQTGFQARPVVGGILVKMLADLELAKKSRDEPSRRKYSPVAYITTGEYGGNGSPDKARGPLRRGPAPR